MWLRLFGDVFGLFFFFIFWGFILDARRLWRVFDDILSEIVSIIKHGPVSTPIAFTADIFVFDSQKHFWLLALGAQNVFLNKFVQGLDQIFFLERTIDYGSNIITFLLILDLGPKFDSHKFQRIIRVHSQSLSYIIHVHDISFDAVPFSFDLELQFRHLVPVIHVLHVWRNVDFRRFHLKFESGRFSMLLNL